MPITCKTTCKYFVSKPENMRSKTSDGKMTLHWDWSHDEPIDYFIVQALEVLENIQVSKDSKCAPVRLLRHEASKRSSTHGKDNSNMQKVDAQLQLYASREYEISVVAIYKENKSEESRRLIFTPPSKVMGIHGRVKDERKLEFSWQSPLKERITKYNVKLICIKNGDNECVLDHTASDTKFECDVKQSSTYYVEVRALSNGKEGLLGEAGRSEELHTAPPPVKFVTIKLDGKDLVFKWEPLPKVEYYRVISYTKNVASVPKIQPECFFCIQYCQPKTTYYLKVNAIYERKDGPQTISSSFTTGKHVGDSMRSRVSEGEERAVAPRPSTFSCLTSPFRRRK